MKRPQLIPLEPTVGPSEALIVMGGGCGHAPGGMGGEAWRSLIRDLGWAGAIYQLQWDEELNLTLGTLTQQEPEAAIAHWNRCRNQFKRIGKSFLPKLIWELNVATVSFWAIAHGTQVAYYGLRDWSEADIHLRDAVLLAGTVRRDRGKDWGRVANNLEGTLFNFYNTEDLMLKRFSQLLDWKRSPCGIKPIREERDRLLNIDATPRMTTAHYTPDNCRAILTHTLKPHWRSQER
ncbi:hypothetical protein PN441_02275 [Spirulina major CS-329]|uniref:hypothetical protein n=1 Tax=Spirulina TaxID=1154 RepID=UPI00232D54F7|nr:MULTISPECIES: hypothetical protein [Spirulina]MDB9494507.1 hypothetical protein [Spirulina subsalsa CS-330]MDB9501882.1 hypothetical protein [Spirulina major CS-329]